MSSITLTHIDGLYRTSDSAVVELQTVQHTPFEKYCIQLRSFERNLGICREDQFWQGTLRHLRKYRFGVTAAPVPFNHGSLQVENLVEYMEARLNDVSRIYPDHYVPMEALTNQLKTLTLSSENPILRELFAVARGSNGRSEAILIKDNSLVPAVKELLDEAEMLEYAKVVSHTDLRSTEIFSRLFIIGAARWFPDYVFTAPRAGSITIVQYEWIADQLPSVHCFQCNKNPGAKQFELKQLPSRRSNELNFDRLDLIAAEELLPSVDWDLIIQDITRSHGLHSTSELVPAKLLLCCDGTGLFCEVDEDASRLIIDIEEEGDQRLKRVSTKSLEPGMFLLIRTEGGGDLVLPIANKILAEHIDHSQHCQSVWKRALKQKVDLMGIKAVVDCLKQSGLGCASETNIRNWITEKNISTGAKSTFSSIMQFIGLADQAETYWNVSQAIRQAHRKAGYVIRKMLLASLSESSLDDLKNNGKQSVFLPSDHGGALTAIRIAEVKQEPVFVPESLIGLSPTRIDNSLWLDLSPQ